MEAASTHRCGYTLQFFAHRRCCCVQILQICVKASGVFQGLLLTCTPSFLFANTFPQPLPMPWTQPFNDDTCFTRLLMLVSSSKHAVAHSLASAAKCARLMSFMLPHSCSHDYKLCHFQHTVVNVILCHMTLINSTLITL